MKVVVVGRVARAHGVRGDVTVDVRTDTPDARFVAGTTFDTERGQLTVVTVRWHSARLLVTFDGVSDRAAAEQLRGTVLELDVPDDERPDDPDEYYDHQLVGLEAFLDTGRRLGAVVEVLHLPGQDVLAIRSEGTEHLVPFVAELVSDVDLGTRRIVVADRPGLIEAGP